MPTKDEQAEYSGRDDLRNECEEARREKAKPVWDKTTTEMALALQFMGVHIKLQEQRGKTGVIDGLQMQLDRLQKLQADLDEKINSNEDSN